MQPNPDLMLEMIRDGAMISQQTDDKFYVDFVRGCGEEGLRKIVEILQTQVDETDESIARYGAELIIRSQLPGRVGAILEVLRLPFRTSKDEVLEAILDQVVGDPEFLGDAEFIAEARRIETRYSWVEKSIAIFLGNSGDNS
ncbi:hypothetical protein TA3x_001662 [Tundrisphaera sp. TA3]|uniref:hypothetical protein n=1 Tax=Tundrisphaera sp. TA3 TaxID=3435775 RepID=UPI003EBE1E1F